MEEIFDGWMWYMISPLLTTDDAVMIRTVTGRWNEGYRYGALRCVFFMMLKLDQYKKVWHYDSDGGRVRTMLRKRSISLRGDTASWTRRGGLDLLRGRSDGFVGGIGPLKDKCTRSTALGVTLGLPMMTLRFRAIVMSLDMGKR